MHSKMVIRKEKGRHGVERGEGGDPEYLSGVEDLALCLLCLVYMRKQRMLLYGEYCEEQADGCPKS